MKVTGIVAEYNPFHRGHQHQLNYIKNKTDADYIIVAMSGDYVQRGTPAIFSKHLRAEMALRCGADLILELPVSAATASAEAFCSSGISLLDQLGVVDALCFGSESGSISDIQKIASVLADEPPAYRAILKNHLGNGESFPVARSRAICEYCDSPQLESILKMPNNILAIEYCKAILRQKSAIKSFTIQREGMGYNDKISSDSSDKFASATAIRDLIYNSSSACDLSAYIPDTIIPLANRALSTGHYFHKDMLDQILIYTLMRSSYSEIAEYLDVSNDLAMRIINSRNDITGFDQAVSLLKTKDITQTRIQRALLHIILGIRETPSQIPYARVLGFRKESSSLLKAIKANSSIPLITKPAAAQKLLGKKEKQLLDETVFSSNLYEKLISSNSDCDFIHEFQKEIVIV